MKKKLTKIQLNKQTISNLDLFEMQKHLGGNSNGNGCYTNHGCGGGTIATNYTCFTCYGKTCNHHCGGGTA